MANPIDTPSKSLNELSDILGAPDEALLQLFLSPQAKLGYQELGRKIASSRVIVDAERLLGLSFATWQAASEAQKAALIGFSEDVLAIGVYAAKQLRDLTATASADSHTDKTARDLAEAATVTTCQRTIVLRDQGVVLLRTIAGPDPALQGRIKAAVGTADTPENLASGTERVAALGLELVASTDPAIALMVKATRATAAYFETLEAAASELRNSIEVARPRLTTTKVNQGELDVLDGLVLRILSDIIHVFAAAQDLDGTIPTLAPLATRRLLASRKKSKVKADVEELETPTETV